MRQCILHNMPYVSTWNTKYARMHELKYNVQFYKICGCRRNTAMPIVALFVKTGGEFKKSNAK